MQISSPHCVKGVSNDLMAVEIVKWDLRVGIFSADVPELGLIEVFFLSCRPA